jgi:hypothetical protein
LTAIFNRVGYTAPSRAIAKCELEICSGKWSWPVTKFPST